MMHFYIPSSLFFFEGVLIIHKVKTIAAYIINIPVITLVTLLSLPRVTELMMIKIRNTTMMITWFLKTDKYLFSILINKQIFCFPQI